MRFGVVFWGCSTTANLSYYYYKGRSWTSPELRLQSFPSLHQLWYILLRERNVLLTQREEARRLRVDLRGFSSQGEKLRMVSSMGFSLGGWERGRGRERHARRGEGDGFSLALCALSAPE